MFVINFYLPEQCSLFKVNISSSWINHWLNIMAHMHQILIVLWLIVRSLALAGDLWLGQIGVIGDFVIGFSAY